MFQEFEDVKEEPNIFCYFARQLGDSEYMPVTSWPSLKALTQEALTSYNEMHAAMNLVLFEDAILHVLAN